MIRPSIFAQTLGGMIFRSRFRCRAFAVHPTNSAISFSLTLSCPWSIARFSAAPMRVPPLSSELVDLVVDVAVDALILK